MHFTFRPTSIGQLPETGCPAFLIDRLWRRDVGQPADVSRSVDRSFPYSSVRELKWHLAERFACPVEAITLERA